MTDDYARALDALNVALAEIQRGATVFASGAVSALLTPYVAAANATTAQGGRDALDRITAALPGLQWLARDFVADSTAAIKGPLAAAYAAIPQEQSMSTRTLTLDFSKDYGIAAPREMVDNITNSDLVIATFVAPKDDNKFRLGITHQSGFPQCQRKVTLTNSTGQIVQAGTASAFDLRMFTARPPARGFNVELIGGETYTVRVKSVDDNDNRCDFFFSVINS